MKRRKKDNLISQYLENISRMALEKYQAIIKDYVRGRHGVYALYRNKRLYYVGLASNLRSRLGTHLRDRHAKTWDSFSVYLSVGEEHLRELEALLLRVVKPKGNVQRGKFGRADDLRKKFRKDIARAQRIELDGIVPRPTRSQKSTPEKPVPKTGRQGRIPALAPFVHRRFHIRLRYKGKLYIAHVRRDGTIRFAGDSAEADRLQGQVFNAPSAAASAVTKRSMNGWTAWEYERAPGDWVPLNELRK